jgi:ABC-type transport system involved in multi-copper enzyme maturation permease subunit
MRAALAAVVSGVGAVGSKELRGRMRGPRAFIALTFYLVLLAGFTVMIYLLQQQAATQAAFGGGNPYVSAQVGQAVFATLLFLQILLVVFLAPAATSGAISLEREKQTLDLLVATPVSTLGIVVGKLASALAFVIVLILASIPLTAVVFVFGGVAPEDIVRAYIVLLVTAIGFGSVGILLSSMTKRTQSATFLTYLVVLVLTVGTGFTWWFWDQMANQQQQVAMPIRDAPAILPLDGATGADDVSPNAETSTGPRIPSPPEALLWLNPVVAAADVICGTDVNPYSTACQLIGGITGKTPGGTTGGAVFLEPAPVKPGVNLGVAVPSDVVVSRGGVGVVGNVNVIAIPGDPSTSTSTRDSFWPQAAVAWLVASVFRRPSRREARP